VASSSSMPYPCPFTPSRGCVPLWPAGNPAPNRKMKIRSACLFTAAVSTAAALHGALAELNVAEGTLETPDSSFISRDMTIEPDFKLELLYRPPVATQGQWVPMTWDTKGRLIVASYNSDHLLRLTIPSVGSNAPVQTEVIMDNVGAAEGLLVAFDSLYMNVNRSNIRRHGIYRLTDTNNDDKYDTIKVVRNLQGNGDHGTHNLRLTPDGQRIMVINGNATLPTVFTSSRVPMIWNEDQLLPRMDDKGIGGHAAGRLRPGGWTASFDKDGNDFRLETMGYRNPVDFTYNKDGELFVYDSDLEFDKGQPWYRPTRVTHHISGGDYGWAHGNGKFPSYYIDTMGPVVGIGSGSPVGTSSGEGTKFPARYQDGLFICDWSYGNLYFVELTPQGSSYTGTAELMASGRPFAVSGVTVNKADGSLLVQTTGTELYRITYTGTASTAPTKPDTTMAAMRNQRKALEQFHGRKDPQAVATVWPFLNHTDRAIRFAARTALEWQDVATWRDRALEEKDPRTALAALVALARVSGTDVEHRANIGAPAPDKALQARILTSLDRIPWSGLGYQDKLDLMRAYTLAFTRFGEEDTSKAGGKPDQLYGVRGKLKLPDEAVRQRLIAKFDPMFPTGFRELNWEMGEILSYLEAPSVVTKMLALMKAAPTKQFYPIQEWVNPQQRVRGTPGTDGGLSNSFMAKQEDEWKYAELLRTVDTGWTPAQRSEYLKWFQTAAATQEGGASFYSYLTFMHGKYLEKLSAADKAALDPAVLTPPAAGRGGAAGGGGAARGGAAGGRGGN
jgi:hypothetical protein